MYTYRKTSDKITMRESQAKSFMVRDFLVRVLVSRRRPFGHAFLQRGAKTVQAVLEDVEAIPVVWMGDLPRGVDVVVMRSDGRRGCYLGDKGVAS